MADKTNLEHDIKKAIQLIEDNKLEKAGHHLKHIAIKAYYSSKDSDIEQDWLNFHKTMNVLGHALLKKDAGSRQYLDRHRRQALQTLKEMLNGESQLDKKLYSYSEDDHMTFLKDKVTFLEKELEKSQQQVLELRKEEREAQH